MSFSRMIEHNYVVRYRRIVASVLWVLLSLFCCRVLGQLLVEFFGVRFLPPSSEWHSGLIPYPWLLTTQILIILIVIKICTDLTNGRGYFSRPCRRLGGAVGVFGSVYLLSMIVRYIVRMSLYPDERWTGGLIPIFFHWVLATLLLTLAFYHLVNTHRQRE